MTDLHLYLVRLVCAMQAPTGRADYFSPPSNQMSFGVDRAYTPHRAKPVSESAYTVIKYTPGCVIGCLAADTLKVFFFFFFLFCT